MFICEYGIGAIILLGITLYLYFTHDEFREHAFMGYPPGTFYEIYPPYRRIEWLLSFAVVALALLWGTINLPDPYNRACLIYLVIYVLVEIFTLIERLRPGYVPFAEFGIGTIENLKKAIIYGTIVFMATVLINSLVTGSIVFQIPTPTDKIDITVNFLIIGVVAPICEEKLFLQLLGASFIESIGIIPSAITLGFAFAWFHYATYGLAFDILFVLFAFRYLVTIFAPLCRTAIVGVLPHFLINSIAVLMQYNIPLPYMALAIAVTFIGQAIIAIYSAKLAEERI